MVKINIKSEKMLISIMFFLIFLGGTAYSFSGDKGHNLAEDYPYQNLTEDEKEGILLMRQEEEMARDVYLTLYDKWGERIFNNIAQSEERHIESMKNLLDKYNLTEPVSGGRGDYENKELEKMYDDLVKEGNQSLLDALKVGAKIEDLDINDLQQLRQQSDNKDILAVYHNLEKGSRNHLRAFSTRIEQSGGEYTSKYITQEEYDSIVSSSKERGVVYGPEKQVVREVEAGNMQGSHHGNSKMRGDYEGTQRQDNVEKSSSERKGFFQNIKAIFLSWFS